MKSKTCCFTGHRIQKVNFEYNESDPTFVKLRQDTKKEIINAIENGYTNFISGMAIGFDMLAAEIVLELKKHYDITLSLALPCPNQDKYFRQEQKIKFREIVEKADAAQVISKEYFNGCMQVRDRYMVDNSSLLIAHYNYISGGTKTTVEYARKKGINIKIISTI